MGLGKFLKKLLPVAQTAGTIVVSQGATGTGFATLARQIILMGGPLLTAKGLATDDQVQAGASAIITLGTLAYGLAKSIKEKKEKVAIADPNTPVRAVLKPE